MLYCFARKTRQAQDLIFQDHVKSKQALEHKKFLQRQLIAQKRQQEGPENNNGTHTKAKSEHAASIGKRFGAKFSLQHGEQYASGAFVTARLQRSSPKGSTSPRTGCLTRVRDHRSAESVPTSVERKIDLRLQLTPLPWSPPKSAACEPPPH